MKETFYFPHDYNAHEDEKILKLMSEMGWEGYGIYWGMIEKLASSSEAKLKLSDLKFIAYGMRIEYDRIEKVIRSYNLFDTNKEYFWSNRLLRHFEDRQEKRKKAQESIAKRWGFSAQNNTNVSKKHTIVSKNDTIKERKGKEKKGESNITRTKFLEFVFLSEIEKKELENKLGNEFPIYLTKLNNYIGSTGKKYKNHYHTILSWYEKDSTVKEKNSFLNKKKIIF